MLVIDEADRMADMGFLPEVRRSLPDAATAQTLLFSATLDGEVERLVDRYMDDPVPRSRADPTVDEMEHRFFLVHQMDKVEVARVRSHDGVDRTARRFVRTKRGADRSCPQLQQEGVRSLAIHGDLRQGARDRALADFIDGKVAVLVATDVAARGIHVDSVDVVVHYDPADDHKAYLHRSGRTARAGRAGVAVTLQLWNQENDTRMIERRLGLQVPVVEVFSTTPASPISPTGTPIQCRPLDHLTNGRGDERAQRVELLARSERPRRRYPAPQRVTNGQVQKGVGRGGARVPRWAHEPSVASCWRHHGVGNACRGRQGQGTPGRG